MGAALPRLLPWGRRTATRPHEHGWPSLPRTLAAALPLLGTLRGGRCHRGARAAPGAQRWGRTARIATCGAGRRLLLVLLRCEEGAERRWTASCCRMDLRWSGGWKTDSFGPSLRNTDTIRLTRGVCRGFPGFSSSSLTSGAVMAVSRRSKTIMSCSTSSAVLCRRAEKSYRRGTADSSPSNTPDARALRRMMKSVMTCTAGQTIMYSAR
mmetsp:Transcript_26722/g.66493  ORF Transcript_26722/g.66493 Transcript_26722/m.66493 type:complete len:210 (+) Transcript_26722:2169-2798(+)